MVGGGGGVRGHPGKTARARRGDKKAEEKQTCSKSCLLVIRMEKERKEKSKHVIVTKDFSRSHWLHNDNKGAGGAEKGPSEES